MREILWTLVLAPALFGVLACAAGTPPPTTSQLCVPGDQKSCACPGQGDGVQVCADDGSRYSTCMGCSTGVGGSTGAGGAGTVGGSGGAPGMGGHGAGGSIDAGAVSDAGDASPGVDATSGAGGATGAGGAAGAPATDGGAIDGAVVDGGGVDGPGVDAPSTTDGGASDVIGGTDAALVGVTITPGPTGMVLGSSNALGVQGPWYAYGDGVGADGTTATGICEANGMHPASACSMIATPAIGSFPNTGGRMCTSGTVAQVIVGANGVLDYANITGAGIGLDLNNNGITRGVLNTTMKGVTGVAFDLEIVALPSLRVEFPTPTDSASAGAAYWGANASFAPSPAVAGTNVLHWADVRVAGATPPAFDPTRIESILFHVPTNFVASAPYSFCISNLRLLTN